MASLNKLSGEKGKIDESLFGLLSVYKCFNTYIKIMVNDDKKCVLFLMTDNPGNWRNISDSELDGYSEIKKIYFHNNSNFVKYISPDHILNYMGQTLGMKLSLRNVGINDLLDEPGRGYFSLEAPYKYLPVMVNVFEKLINLTPQRKYEIIENYYSARS